MIISPKTLDEIEAALRAVEIVERTIHGTVYQGGTVGARLAIDTLREHGPALIAAAKKLAEVEAALSRIAKYRCGYGDPGECSAALHGDTSSVDRPCAACIAREALAK